MAILLKARCRIIQPNWRIVRSVFDDMEHNEQEFGEYAMFNLLRGRGDLVDGKPYLITIDPLFPHTLKG